MKKQQLRIVLIGLILIGMIGLGVARALLDGIVKARLERAGQKVTQVSVALDSVHLSLIAGRVELQGLRVGNPAGFKGTNAIRIGKILISLHMSSLLTPKCVLRRVQIVQPRLTLEGGLGDNNLTAILHHLESGAGTGRRLEVNDLTLTGTQVSLSNVWTGGRPVLLRIPDIQLRGLGKGPKGITATELGQRVMGKVMAEVLAASFQNLEQAGRAALKAIIESKPTEKGHPQ